MQKLSQAVTSNPKTGLKRINLGKNTIDDRGKRYIFFILLKFNCFEHSGPLIKIEFHRKFFTLLKILY